MKKDPVVVGICVPTYKHPTLQFWRSYNQLWKPYGASPHFPAGSATMTADQQGWMIDDARNALTDDMLRIHESEPGAPRATHILFIDDDMMFPPHALKQLLSYELPIVGGLCHNRRAPYNPILCRRHQNDRGLEEGVMGFLYDLPEHGLVEVDATGGAFLLVERQVFEAISAKFGPHEWWRRIDRASEDFSFCMRAQACGFQIHVDVGLDIGHVGEIVVDRAFAKRNRDFEVNTWVAERALADGKPVASIIIPTYNQKPKYLKAAVLSAAHQTVPVEVIVVDDGSDEPVKLTGWPPNVRVMQHARRDDGTPDLSYLRHGEAIIYTGGFRPDNRGISAALNTGISHMTTDWFCWLSSDDMFDPRKVERQLSMLRVAGGKAGFHRYQAYTGNDAQGIDAYPRHSGLVKWRDVSEQRAILARACAINGSTVMIHKSVFDHVGLFDPEYRFGQDWELWCRIGKHYFWYPLDEVLGTRREHGNLTEAIAESAADDPRRLRRDAEDASIRERYKWPEVAP